MRKSKNTLSLNLSLLTAICRSTLIVFSLLVVSPRAHCLTDQQVKELSFNLDQQIKLMAAQDIDKMKWSPDEVKKFEAVKKKILADKAQLMKSNEGKHLLSAIKRIELVQSMQKQLSDCAKGKSSRGVLKDVMGQLLNDKEVCGGLLQDQNFNQLLKNIALPLEQQKKIAVQNARSFKAQLISENVRQSALRFAELQYLFTDFEGQSQNLLDAICSNANTCERVARDAGFKSVSDFKSDLQRIMNERKEELKALKTPRQSKEQFANYLRCKVLGCSGQPGLISSINRSSGFSMTLGQVGIPLDQLKSGVDTSLALRPRPAQMDSTQQMTASSDERNEAAQRFNAWWEDGELQGQALIAAPIQELESHAAVQVLGGDSNFRKALCVPGCEFNLFQNTEGRVFAQLQNSEGARLEAQPGLLQIKQDPKRFVEQTVGKITKHLTSGLADIVKDVYSAQSDKSNQEDVAKLVQGNPLAAARLVVDDPSQISSLCMSLQNIPESNPWKDTLIVVGGIGASVLGGIVAGPVGFTIAAAAVSVGSAGYSAYQSYQMSGMAKKYEVACGAQSTLTQDTCKSYHEAVGQSQLLLLSAAVDLATVGAGAQFQKAARSSRDLAQAFGEAKSVQQALQFVKSNGEAYTELAKGVPSGLIGEIQAGLAKSSYVQQKLVLSELGEAKKYLKPAQFQALVKKALQSSCSASVKQHRSV